MKLRYLAGLLIGIILFWLFLRGVDLHELYKSLRSAHIIPILIAFAINFTTYYLRSLRWQLILEPVKRVSGWQCFKITAVGFMCNNLIPRTGDLARPILMSQHEKLPFSTCFATIFVERVFDFLFLFIILSALFLSLYVNESIVDQEMYDYMVNAGTILILVTLIILVVMLLMVFQKERMIVIMRWVTRPFPFNLSMRIEQLVNQFGTGMDIMKNPRKLVSISILSLLMWEFLVIQIGITFHAFESYLAQSTSLFNVFWVSNFAIVIAALAFMVPSPGGVGSFHLAVSKTLEVFGELPVYAKSIAIVVHFFSVVPIIFVGFYFMCRGTTLSLKDLLSGKMPPVNSTEQE